MIIFPDNDNCPKSEAGSATTPLLGTNVIVASHAVGRIMASADDRPRSVNRNYPQRSPAHSSQMINHFHSPITMSPFSLVIFRLRYSQWTIFVDFIDLRFCRPFQHGTMASFIQASPFYSVRRPSLPRCMQHGKFLVYIPRNGRIALNWISDTFVARTGDSFTPFSLPSPRLSCDNPSDYMIISITL
jgi:hypothetical protein